MAGISSNSNLPPDPEIIARAWCLEKTAITNIVGTRIATRLPQNPTLPFLVITKFGVLSSIDILVFWQYQH